MSITVIQGPPEDSLTLAEIKMEYIAFLLESAFQNRSEPPRTEDVLEKALYYRLSVEWMGGHGDCVFALGSRNLSCH